MTKEPRGRIFQDSQFDFIEFNGLRIEKLIVCQDTDSKEPILIYIKMENRNWHQYFLDAGIGFWENWDDIDIEDDSYDFIDFTYRYDLKHEVVNQIYCRPDINNSRITLVLKSTSRLILKCKEPEIFDSKCELILEKAGNTC